MKIEIVFILDRSGSMSGLENDTIGGFNGMLAKQKELGDDARVTTVLFDDHYEVLHNRLAIQKVPALTDSEYTVRGSTALLDAIGRAVTHINESQNGLALADKAQKIIFIITTDGEENSSFQYSVQTIKKLISKQKELGWDFIFLGANIDAIHTAQSFGLDEADAVDFIADSKGTHVTYAAISEAITSIRTTGKRTKTWKTQAEQDFKERS